MTTPFPRLVNPLGIRSLYSPPPERLDSVGFLLSRFNERAGLAVKFAGTTCGSVISRDVPTTWVLFAHERVRPLSMSRAGNLTCFDLLLIILRHISALRLRVFVAHYFAQSAMNLTILRNVLGFTALA
jgi:hypothetical protein